MANIVHDEIFVNSYIQGYKFPFADLKDCQPDDLIQVFFDDEVGQIDVYIIRPREETPEEEQERVNKENLRKKELRERRYANYLKLKEEFGNLYPYYEY